MSIRPVDFQVMIQRSSEINRLTNNDGSRAEQQNTQHALSFQKTLEQEGKQVVNTSQAERPDVDKDGRRGGKGDEKQKKRRPDSGSANKEDSKNPPKGKMLDIRI